MPALFFLANNIPNKTPIGNNNVLITSHALQSILRHTKLLIFLSLCAFTPTGCQEAQLIICKWGCRKGWILQRIDYSDSSGSFFGVFSNQIMKDGHRFEHTLCLNQLAIHVQKNDQSYLMVYRHNNACKSFGQCSNMDRKKVEVHNFAANVSTLQGSNLTIAL